MTAERDIRIADADRNIVVERLQQAYAEGRIVTAELEERIEAVHRARVRSDLAPVVADLPGAPLQTQALAPISRGQNPRIRRVVRRARPLLMAPIICTVIWLMTMPGGYFWPMWVYFGCSIPILAIALGSDSSERSEPE